MQGRFKKLKNATSLINLECKLSGTKEIVSN